MNRVFVIRLASELRITEATCWKMANVQRLCLVRFEVTQLYPVLINSTLYRGLLLGLHATCTNYAGLCTISSIYLST